MLLNRVTLAGLLLAGVGCTAVRAVKPAEYIPQHNPDVVWVTYTDNSFVPVAGPKIVGDSLIGTWKGLNEPVAISLGEIQTVQAKMPAPKKTALLFGIAGVATAAVIYTISTAGNSGNPAGCGYDKNGQPNTMCP